jgi:alkylated DNA nucleotide flippase Atl1
MIVSGAAEEDLGKGKKRVTPYWRVVKNDVSLNPKFVGGFENQSARLLEEGHLIEAGRGKKPPRVQDFESKLMTL